MYDPWYLHRRQAMKRGSRYDRAKPTEEAHLAATFQVKADNALTILKDVIVDIATLARPVTATAVATLVVTLVPSTHLDSATLATILAAVGSGDLVLEHLLDITPPAAQSTRFKVDSLLTTAKDILLKLVTLRSPVAAAAIAGFIITLVPGIGIDPTTLAGIIVGVGTVDAALEKILPTTVGS